MKKPTKKSLETERKINLHHHFTLSEYLALNKTNDYYIIDCTTLEVNRESLVSFIDEHLLKKYNQVIDNKLALVYGVDKSYSYFDLFQHVLDINKLVHHSKISFLKDNGLREFYYALKKLNEDYDYKEGLIFELTYKVHKSMIKYSELFKIICDVVVQEAKSRVNKAVFIATMTDPLITSTQVADISDNASILKIPDLNNKYDTHLDYLNEKTKKRAVKSSTILHDNSKYKSTILGYKEKRGIFGKETYLIEKDPFNALVYGSGYVTDTIFHNFMYQSIFNKKGFIYFNFGETGMEEYIYSLAHNFNVIDEVIYIYHGSKEFYELDLNRMIINNKIVIIQLANTERVSEERVLEGYSDFDKLLSSITTDSSSEYPYSIFLDSPFRYPDSFCKSLDTLINLKNLGYSSLLKRTHIDKDIDVQFVNSFENILIFKSHEPHFLLDMLKNHQIDIRDAVDMEDYQFFFYRNGSFDNKIYNSLIFF
jgi:hypothetical protein